MGLMIEEEEALLQAHKQPNNFIRRFSLITYRYCTIIEEVSEKNRTGTPPT